MALASGYGYLLQNLDSAIQRRAHIEENLALNGQGTRFKRIAAYDSEYIKRHQISASIQAPAKAYFLSHIGAIEASLETGGLSLNLEDDAILGTRIIEILNALLPLHDELDLLFTDLYAASMMSMLQFFKLCRDIKDSVGVFDARQYFAASSGYLLPNIRTKNQVTLSSEIVRDIGFPIRSRTSAFDDERLIVVVFRVSVSDLIIGQRHAFSDSDGARQTAECRVRLVQKIDQGRHGFRCHSQNDACPPISGRPSLTGLTCVPQ